MTPPDDDRPPAPPEKRVPSADRGSTPAAAVTPPPPADERAPTDPRGAPPEEAPARPKASWRWSTAFRAVSRFSPNDLVAGRFRIVRFIASGGMGEVYEVRDLELKESVALKTVRPEIAEEERVMARFRREIQLARKVTHPSVCRIFDVFKHRLPAPEGWQGPAPEVAFLTMELLEGDTLTERIKTKGPLKEDEALPIVQQIASGLAAAHEAGVVHRDFKSSNVILVPPKESDKGIRAVVTDFGLAQGRGSAGGFTSSGTGAGGLSGTPAYMAPEQVQSGDTTPATDVYALGVVMYEMVTGKWPFEGDTPLTMAIKRLNERPPSPRTHAPDLDPRWEATILRCLERDPLDRFGGALEVLKALAGEQVARSPTQKRHHRQRIAWAVALPFAILLGAGVWLTRSSRPPAPTAPVPAVAARRSVAVLGFKNLTGRQDAAWLTRALSEMLTMELAAGGKLRVIPGENVARTRIDLSLPETESLAPDTLARIRTSLGTDLVVLGSYFAAGIESGGQLRLDLRVQDAAAGETVASLSETGTEAQFLDLVSRAGAQLRRTLGAAEPAAATLGESQTSLPSNPEAARLYAEGLGKLRLFDAVASRDLLREAAAAEPRYPLMHSALAEAWSVLGYGAKAKEEAKTAFDLSGSLPREERLSVEGLYRAAAGEWDKAVETYRTLWRFFPDNLEYGLRLAAAQTSAGERAEALATVESLRGLQPPASEDPRIDLEEARAANALGSFKRAAAAASRAAVKGEAWGARLLLARARLAEGYSLQSMGEPDQAVRANDAARQIYDAAGDRGGVARSLLQTAGVLRYRGDLGGAKRMAEEALAISREIGDKGGARQALNRLAGILAEQGPLDRAKKMYEEALKISREIGDKSGEGTAVNNVGVTLWQQGDLPAARQRLEEAEALFRKVGSRRGLCFALFNDAFVRFDQGDLAGAKKGFEASLAISREIGEKSLSAVATFGLGTLLAAEGDLGGARKKQEEALAVRRALDEKGRAAESLLGLAMLSLEEGRPAEAEAGARAALSEFQAEQASPSEAFAQAVLAESLMAGGKPDEAMRAVRAAAAFAKTGQHRSIRLAVGIRAARIRASSGRAAEAAGSLRSLLTEAKQAGLVPLELESRLALGELETTSGAGRGRLLELEREASAKGFLLVARKARRALS